VTIVHAGDRQLGQDVIVTQADVKVSEVGQSEYGAEDGPWL
jgi:hypothetical protein